MFHKQLQSEIEDHLKTLEAIYFLVHSLGDNSHRLEWIRRNFQRANREQKLKLRDELRSEVKWARMQVGALTSNKEYQRIFDEIRAQPGYVYLQKIYIDRELFDNYARFFPRWPHVKLHAASIFDGQRAEGTNQLYEIEGPRLQDAREFLVRAELAEKGVKDFRKRTKRDQLEALMFARASILATLTFVEAYLNGLSYDCLQENHDKLPIDDHDLLGEWDSSKKRRRFVDFKDKVFKYPVIVGRMRGFKVDLSGFKPAHEIAGFAKQFRDALVHPSPFPDPHTRKHEKFIVAVGANRTLAAEILKLALEYAEFVEQKIGNNPKLTAPWLYKDVETESKTGLGKPGAEQEIVSEPLTVGPRSSSKRRD
jgi:hypothetical protein